MSRDRQNDKSVVVYQSNDLFEVEAIAQQLRDHDIPCHVAGQQTSGAFMGWNTLDGVTMMSVIVLESDAEAAHQIARDWLDAPSPDRDGPGN
ncbi:MAG: DUF2007 domain-containing protein [Phycisphaeraceae bacterium]|nr:DUF2007 domain-containing protein [Phycisphaeraceae bacterium]